MTSCLFTFLSFYLCIFETWQPKLQYWSSHLCKFIFNTYFSKFTSQLLNHYKCSIYCDQPITVTKMKISIGIVNAMSVTESTILFCVISQLWSEVYVLNKYWDKIESKFSSVNDKLNFLDIWFWTQTDQLHS